MTKEKAIQELKSSQIFFNNSSECLQEEHSSFKPKDEMFSVVNQVQHVAHTIVWFMDGAFSENGFAMDFEEIIKENQKVTSLKEAKENFNKNIKMAISKIENCTEEEFQKLIVPGPIMGGEPRSSAIYGILEHTAHHRGALSVYSRLLGLTPKMPYM